MSPFVSAPSSPFEPPSLAYQLLTSPITTLVRHIYSLVLYLRGPPFEPPQSPIRIICISDTHTHTSASIPAGDLLVHAGDLTNDGTSTDIQAQIDWLSSLPHTEKVVIAGNHDSYLDPRSRRLVDEDQSLNWGKIHYLQHSSITLAFPHSDDRRLKIYGAPQIPRCGGRDFAFQYERREDTWTGTIPLDVDVLVTHTPPRHHLDLPARLGCAFLLKEVWKIRPKVHIFGHVHAGHGRESVFWDGSQAAYERICDREDVGILWDLVSLYLWMDVIRLLWRGLLGIIWSRLWSGGGGGVMINAALAYRSTGRLGNAPQILEI